jgi:hypothetical protein
MKNYLASLLLLLSTGMTLSSCRETSKLPEPKNESVPLIIPEINPQKSFFPFNRSRESVNTNIASGVARPEFEFVVNPSQGYGELQTVEVYKSFRRGQEGSTLAYGPRVKVTDLTSFPATITLNSQDALRGLFPTATGTTPVLATSDNAINRLVSPLVSPTGNVADNIANDAIVFTFEYIMKDGRRIILTPVSAANTLLPSSLVNKPLAAVAEFK